MADDLDYKDVNHAISKIDYSKMKKKNNISINAFCYESGLVYPGHISKQQFEKCIDLLLINDENKSHYVNIKDFNRFMFHKIKHKNKKTLADIVYIVIVLKKPWKNIKRYL